MLASRGTWLLLLIWKVCRKLFELTLVVFFFPPHLSLAFLFSFASLFLALVWAQIYTWWAARWTFRKLACLPTKWKKNTRWLQKARERRSRRREKVNLFCAISYFPSSSPEEIRKKDRPIKHEAVASQHKRRETQRKGKKGLEKDVWLTFACREEEHTAAKWLRKRVFAASSSSFWLQFAGSIAVGIRYTNWAWEFLLCAVFHHCFSHSLFSGCQWLHNKCLALHTAHLALFSPLSFFLSNLIMKPFSATTKLDH